MSAYMDHTSERYCIQGNHSNAEFAFLKTAPRFTVWTLFVFESIRTTYRSMDMRKNPWVKTRCGNNPKSLKIAKDVIIKKFTRWLSNGNVTDSKKLLSDNMCNGILPLNQLALNQLKQKHRQDKQADFNVLVADTPQEFHPTKFDELETELVKTAAVRKQKVEQKHQK